MSVSPAGWQPDPRGRHEYRYWDGTQWTDHVSDRGEMSTDPVAATQPRPDPVAAPPDPAAPGPGSSAPPRAGAASSAAGATAAQQLLHSRSPELASILSVIAPGSGHFYVRSPKVPLAAGLLVATAAAVVLAYLSFVLFLVGFALWAAAAAFALIDLRGGVKGIENTTLPLNVVAILTIAAGAVLIIALLLPWYHVKASGSGISVSNNGSGFEALEGIDIVLLVIGIAAVAAGAATLGLVVPISSGELARAIPMAVAAAGALATGLVLFRMFVDTAPGGLGGGVVDITIGRAPGILLALDAALVLLLANAAVLRSAAR